MSSLPWIFAAAAIVLLGVTVYRELVKLTWWSSSRAGMSSEGLAAVVAVGAMGAAAALLGLVAWLWGVL